ncbi:unnamed protein product, partial [Urochloa humidicola]
PLSTSPARARHQTSLPSPCRSRRRHSRSSRRPASPCRPPPRCRRSRSVSPLWARSGSRSLSSSAFSSSSTPAPGPSRRSSPPWPPCAPRSRTPSRASPRSPAGSCTSQPPATPPSTAPLPASPPGAGSGSSSWRWPATAPTRHASRGTRSTTRRRSRGSCRCSTPGGSPPRRWRRMSRGCAAGWPSASRCITPSLTAGPCGCSSSRGRRRAAVKRARWRRRRSTARR